MRYKKGRGAIFFWGGGSFESAKMGFSIFGAKSLGRKSVGKTSITVHQGKGKTRVVNLRVGILRVEVRAKRASI